MNNDFEPLKDKKNFVNKAKKALGGDKPTTIEELMISNFSRVYGHCLEIDFQSDPVSKVGIDGLQWTVLIQYAIKILEQFDKKFPCEENTKTLSLLDKAIKVQEQRTKDRAKRGVEGKNKI